MQDLARLVEHAVEFLECRGLSPRVVYMANLALEEILTNVLKYGYDDHNEHRIEVSLEIGDYEVVIECSDDGRPFNPLSAPTPQMKDSVHECEEGGLGLHLVREMVNRMTYRYQGGRNLLTMGIKRQAD